MRLNLTRQPEHAFDLKASSTGGGDPDANSTANKSDEMVMSSDIWGDYSVNEPQYYSQYGIAEYDTGSYSLAKGGVYEQYIQLLYGTEDYVYVLAPGGAATDLYYSDSWGNSNHWTGVGDLWQVFTPGPGGTYEIDPVTEGSLNAGPQEGYVSQGINSNEKMMFFTGGPGPIGLQVLLGANASAQPEMVLPTYITDGNPFNYSQITIGQLGLEGSDGWAYGLAANGTPADVTPTANAPMYVSWPDATKYHCYFTAYAEEPNPGSGRWAAYYPGEGFGHSWWSLTSDAPSEGLLKVGVQYLYYLGGAAGYFPTDQTIWLTLVDVPGVLRYPNGGGNETVHRRREIGINGLKGGLAYTEAVAALPDYYDLFDQNCTTVTVKAGAHSGVTLPNDIYPQIFGIDLSNLPPDDP